MPLSVSELVDRIKQPGDDVDTLMARVRGWTRDGLLEPEGDVNTGTGNRRLYPDEAAIDAAILNLLADAGLPGVRAKPYFKDLFAEVRAELRRKKDRPSFATIAFGAANTEIDIALSEKLGPALRSSPETLFFVIDLTKLHQRFSE